MLTARADTIDVVVGLESGADDYVRKPFEMPELVARVRAALRRRVADAPSGGVAVLDLGALRIDLAGRTVERDGADVPLTRTEFDLLVELARHPGQVFPRDQLLDRVWGYDYLGDSRLVDVAIGRLRAKVELTPPRRRWSSPSAAPATRPPGRPAEGGSSLGRHPDASRAHAGGARRGHGGGDRARGLCVHRCVAARAADRGRAPPGRLQPLRPAPGRVAPADQTPRPSRRRGSPTAFRLRGDVETIADFGAGDCLRLGAGAPGSLAEVSPGLRAIVARGELGYAWQDAARSAGARRGRAPGRSGARPATSSSRRKPSRMRWRSCGSASSARR